MFAVPSRIEGLALDLDSQKLYYTDRVNYLIGVMSTDGSDHRVLVEISGSRPRAIVVDSVNGYAYTMTMFNESYLLPVGTQMSSADAS